MQTLCLLQLAFPPTVRVCLATWQLTDTTSYRL